MAPNPHHRRASLVLMTEKGQGAFDQPWRLTPWMNRLASDIKVEDIEAMQRVLALLQVRLDAELGGAEIT